MVIPHAPAVWDEGQYSTLIGVEEHYHDFA
jgi:hypothetical protein